MGRAQFLFVAPRGTVGADDFQRAARGDYSVIMYVAATAFVMLVRGYLLANRAFLRLLLRFKNLLIFQVVAKLRIQFIHSVRNFL